MLEQSIGWEGRPGSGDINWSQIVAELLKNSMKIFEYEYE